MKLFAKIFLCATLILSIALSLSGYLLITSSYKNAVEQETQRAEEHYQYIKFVLQANLLDRQGIDSADPISSEDLAGMNLPGLSDGGNYISVLRDDRSPIYSTFPDDVRFDLAGYDLEQKLIIKTEQIGDRSYVLVCGRIVQSGLTVYLLSATDIQPVIEQREKMVRDYGTIYFVTIGVGIVFVLIFSALLTGPIRSMSAAAARIADGHYHERLRVFSHDEIGELSKEFNTMAETVEERIAELSQIARQREDFVSNFAHEMKTPLTSVIGYADILYQKQLSREDTRKAAGYILDEGLRLEALSRKLMDLTVLNRQDFALEQLPADELLQNIAETLRLIFANAGVAFSLTADRAYIQVDYDLFKTLLLNLIDNAVKAGSTVIALSGSAVEGRYRVKVADNGQGIPEEELARITEAFYMVDKSRSRRQHGAGLGLALASKIAEIHGGRLTFASAPGRGTTVTLLLPMERRGTGE